MRHHQRGIDAGQPWRRSIADNITYTDWTRDNMWRAVASVTGFGKASAARRTI
jgi:creatinase